MAGRLMKITGLDCYRSQNENQRITIAKFNRPDISDNDSKSVNVTSKTHPVTTETDNTCDLMNNDAFNDIFNIMLPFKRSSNYNKFKYSEIIIAIKYYSFQTIVFLI